MVRFGRARRASATILSHLLLLLYSVLIVGTAIAGEAEDGRDLREAALHGDAATVREMLATSAGAAAVNAADVQGFTPLLYASKEGHDDVALDLLRGGADGAAASSDGWTALHGAAEHGLHRLAEFLLLLGEPRPAVDVATSDGTTPLMVAAFRGRLAVVRLLLQHGAAVNKRDGTGLTALMAAASQGDTDMVRHLLSAGARPNMAMKDGNTALILSAINGNGDIPPLLIAAGAAVNQANRAGNTPLLLASYVGNLRVVRQLLEAGADVNKTDRKGTSPLMAVVAATDCFGEVARVLLRAGAHVPRSLWQDEVRLFGFHVWGGCWKGCHAVSTAIEEAVRGRSTPDDEEDAEL